jgi:hypothetical protein
VETATDFSIVDNLPGLGVASYFQQAFTAPAGTIIGPATMSNRTVIARVVGKKEADMNALAGERKDLLLGLKAARAQQTNTLWMDAMVKKMEEAGKIKVYQDQVDKVLALYR